MIASARRELPVDADLRRLNIHAYAIDSTTIDLTSASSVEPCLRLFPWAQFRRRKAGVKAHTMIDLRVGIPVFMRITHAKVSDVSILDQIVFIAGAFYVMDRGYIDFARFYRKRWMIELLFKWMKQHLHIKAFFGTTPNAVKTQLWIAVIVLVLVHRLKHRWALRQTPNEIV
jgi:hypothetical protein